jgi:hypothetical protein
MDFFYTNNLITNEFLSLLVSWKIGGHWRVDAVGYPSLKLDIAKGRVSLLFISVEGKRTPFGVRTDEFEISMNESKDSLLLENKYDEVDWAIVFRNRASCQRFNTLLMRMEIQCSLKSKQHSITQSISAIKQMPNHKNCILSNSHKKRREANRAKPISP